MESPTLGRPVIKPKRRQTNFHINVDSIDKMQQLMFKWGESSLNDTYNRMINENLKRDKI